MQRRPLETTQRKAERSNSQPIRQTSSGNKNLKLTSKGQNVKTIPSSKQKKDPLLKVSQSPKNKKPPLKQQTPSPNPKKKESRQASSKKQKARKKIISYKSQDSEKQSELKISAIQIDIPNLDDAIDDDINLLSISNYPIKNNSQFLRETHLTSGQSKKQYVKADVKKQDELKKSTGKIRKTNSKKPKDTQSRSSRTKTNSEKKYLLGSNRKQSITKSHKKLQKSIPGLKISLRPIQKSTKGALSKTKKGKKEKSSSTETNKGNSPKKGIKPGQEGKSGKSPIPKQLPKSIPKPSKSKKKKSPQRNNFHLVNTAKPMQQQSSSDTTKTPTLQELQRLRQQNEKYKMFLATSAFKVEDLKRQIEQHKQIRQNQRGIYNFQLNNLKKQLEANKKSLGHLYSYDEPSNIPGFIPDQIIVQTDNQSSSMLDSMNVISKVSKQLQPDQLYSEGSSNKIRKSNQSIVNIGRSNPSSSSNQEDAKLTKTHLTAMIRQMKEDLMKEQAQLKFLSDIQKIPSLEVRLSLEESDNSNNAKENQDKLLSATSKPKNFKDSLNYSKDQGDNALLLLNSIGK